MTQTLLYNPKPKRSPAESRKARNQRILQAAREAGVIGQPRPKMTDEERKARRNEHNKAYRETIKKARKRTPLWQLFDDSGRTLSDFQKGQMELDKVRRKVYEADNNSTI